MDDGVGHEANAVAFGSEGFGARFGSLWGEYGGWRRGRFRFAGGRSLGSPARGFCGGGPGGCSGALNFGNRRFLVEIGSPDQDKVLVDGAGVMGFNERALSAHEEAVPEEEVVAEEESAEEEETVVEEE